MGVPKLELGNELGTSCFNLATFGGRKTINWKSQIGNWRNRSCVTQSGRIGEFLLDYVMKWRRPATRNTRD